MAIDQAQFITGSVQAASSMNVVLTGAVTAGNSIVVAFSGWGNVANHVFGSIVDNVNANAYTVGCLSTLATDTNAQCVTAYKLNISSGAGGSTYRVSANSAGGVADMSVTVSEFSGGPFTVGSTGSSNNAGSSLARGPALTASSTPVLFFANATHTDTNAFKSTINTGVMIALLNPANNTGQILISGYSTNSSLTQQPTFSLSSGTSPWVANDMVFMGLGAGGVTATNRRWRMGVMGTQ